MVSLFKFIKNKINKTKFGSYCLNGIPEGCKYCIRGEKLVLFVTGKCATKCLYCPLSELRKDSSQTWANERECRTVGEVIDEAYESNSKGVGITGGDPLVVLSKTLKYAKALKKEFGKNFHIHIYLSTKLVSEKNLKQLSKVVDEVRFHPVYLLDIKKQKEDVKKIKLASKFFKRKNIGIEVPLFPDKKKEIFSFIKKVERLVSFVNLNELEIGDSNFNYILKKYNVDKNGYTVKNSIKSGLWILKQCIRECINLKMHLCTAETKNWYQFKNRLLKHNALPFGERTKEGTVVYYSIFKKDNLKFDNLKKYLREQEGFFDKRKNRIIVNRQNLAKFSKSYRIRKTEEYPTYDLIEVEEYFIN